MLPLVGRVPRSRAPGSSAALDERERADRTRTFQGSPRGTSMPLPVGTFDVEVDIAVEQAEANARRIRAGAGEPV